MKATLNLYGYGGSYAGDEFEWIQLTLTICGHMVISHQESDFWVLGKSFHCHIVVFDN